MKEDRPWGSTDGVVDITVITGLLSLVEVTSGAVGNIVPYCGWVFTFFFEDSYSVIFRKWS